MPPIVLGEYRDQHGKRCYPFLDTATLTDGDGWVLPTDFIIDAFLYPIDLTNGLYLSQIDRNEAKIYFADTVTDKVHGVAVIGSNDTAFVYEPDGLERQIGVITFGDSKNSGLQGRPLRTFTPVATELTPTAYIPLNQVGARAIQLEDGTLLTGDIKFVGEDGVNVKSYYDTDGNHILEISIVGVPKAPDPDCFDCGYIEEICVHREPGSVFMVSELPNGTIAIDVNGFTLDDICSAQRLLRLPNDEGKLPPAGDEPCDPPSPGPVDPDPGDPVDFCFSMDELVGGTLQIVTPSTPGDWNPLQVHAMHGFAEQGNQRLRVPARPINNSDDLEAAVDRFRDPLGGGDGIQLGFKGLALFREARNG